MVRQAFRDESSPYTAKNAKGEQRLVTADGDGATSYGAPLPWEGLGHEVGDRTTVKGMMHAAGLNWKVTKTQLHDDKGPVPSYALRRSDNGGYLDTVGSAYTPVQNETAFDFFNGFVEKGGAKMSIAGLIGGGRYVWGLADLGTSFALKGGDDVRGYLLVACPHIQGKKFVVKYTTIRRLCNNMLSSALREQVKSRRGGATIILPEFRHAHRTEFDAPTADRARTVLETARAQHEAFGETAKKLQKKTMTREDTLSILAPIFAPSISDEDLAEQKLTPRLEELMSILHHAPGAQPDNAWGVLNAVTYYATHVAGRSQDRRLGQMWMGKTGNQIAEVQAALIAA